jgi:hypothetical protein
MATVLLRLRRGNNPVAETTFNESQDFRLSGINSSGLAAELNGSTQVANFLSSEGAQVGDLLTIRLVGERIWHAAVESGLQFSPAGTANVDR